MKIENAFKIMQACRDLEKINFQWQDARWCVRIEDKDRLLPPELKNEIIKAFGLIIDNHFKGEVKKAELVIQKL